MASVYPDVVIVQSQRADEGSGVPVKQPLRPLRPITTVTLVREVRDRPTDLWRSGVRRVRDRPTDPGPGVQIFGRRLGKSAERCQGRGISGIELFHQLITKFVTDV